MTVSFEITDTDRAIVVQIADRAEAEGLIRGKAAPDHWYERETLEMDLTAANANGNPIDFSGLLAADGITFVHDIAGIAKHMDRKTGKMPRFRPRMSTKGGEAPPPTESMTATQKAQLACTLLRNARDLLKGAGATKAAAKVRLALSSAEGAVRHAGLRQMREG